MALRIPYRISHRDVKYPRLEFKTGELVCILPSGEKPDKILEKHREWINGKIDFIAECLKDAKRKKLAHRTNGNFRNLAFSYVSKISGVLGIEPNRVYFRTMKTKWASLSQKRNLTLNTLMRHLPGDLIEYIIFHEMTHVIEKRHNENFWKVVSERFSDYQDRERDLFVYWFLITKKPPKSVNPQPTDYESRGEYRQLSPFCAKL